MFISSAWAQEAATAAAEQSAGSPWVSMLPLLLIFIIFYLLVIRPQSKRIKEHQEMIHGLKAGDKVVTGGGLHGKIVKVEDRDVVVEIAPGVQVTAQKHTVHALSEVTPPVVAKDKK